MGVAPRPVQASMLVVFTCASRPHLGAFPRISHFRGIALGGVPIESGRARWKLAAPSGGAPHHQIFLSGALPRAPSLFHCVKALFCRCRGGWLQAYAPPRTAPADSSARDRRARSAPGPLGVRKGPRRRLPSTARASGARGLRRDRPPAAPAHGKPPSQTGLISFGVGKENPPGGWGGYLSGGHGVPSVRIRGGVSVTRPFADTEGPHPGTHCWVVAAGVSARRERGRASAERSLTRRAKQRPHAVEPTRWRRLQAHGAEENLHGVENKTSPGHPRHWQRKGLP